MMSALLQANQHRSQSNSLGAIPGCSAQISSLAKPPVTPHQALLWYVIIGFANLAAPAFFRLLGIIHNLVVQAWHAVLILSQNSS
jgi:hypothetical protein